MMRGSAFAVGSRPRTIGGAPRILSGLDRSWDLLLLCVAGLVLTAAGRVHQLFPFLEPLRPMLGLGILGLAVYALDATLPRRVRALTREPTTWALVALLVWVALSVPTALRQYTAFMFLVDDFAKTVILYALIVGSVRGLRDVDRFAWVYFVAAGVYAMIVLARFNVGAVSWRLQNLYTYDPNDFALFAVTAMPLGLVAMTTAHSPTRKILALLGLAILSVAFVWAGSRGGFLALLCTGAYLVVRYRAIRLRWRLIATAVVGLTVVAVAGPMFWEQMQTLLHPGQDYNFTAPTGRIEVWKRAVGYMMHHPVLGVGAANFPAAEGNLSPLAHMAEYGHGVRWSAAHNTFLQVGAELGFPGLMIYLVFLGLAFRALRDVERACVAGVVAAEGGMSLRLAQALRASLLGFLVGGFFLSLAYADMLYILIALAVGLRKATLGSWLPSRSVAERGRPRVQRGAMHSGIAGRAPT